MMGQKKDVKLEDIAEELGISIVSVSNALNGRKGVGAKLREKVLQKAEELGYQSPQSNEKIEAKSYRIGVIIAERYVREYPSFYMDVYKQVAQVVTKQGSLIVLEIVDIEKEKMEHTFKLFHNVDVQGIILIGEMNPAFINWMKGRFLAPIVCVDFYSVERGMDYIVTDSFHGTSALTQMLIDAGHTDIGFVGTPRATNSIMDRYMGYCRTLEENGLKERKEWLIFDREEDGYGYIYDFKLPVELPTAFVCNCDKVAYQVIDKLKKGGIRVPQDISIVGFDHSYPSGTECIEITTYESDERAMAQISVNTLMKRIENKGKPEGVRTVEGGVVEGDSIWNRKR